MAIDIKDLLAKARAHSPGEHKAAKRTARAKLPGEKAPFRPMHAVPIREPARQGPDAILSGSSRREFDYLRQDLAAAQADATRWKHEHRKLLKAIAKATSLSDLQAAHKLPEKE